MGRATEGVRGMTLRGEDEVIAVEIADDDSDLLVVTENGYGKRTRVSEYPRKGRGGMGVKTVQLTEARGKLAGARVVRDGYQVMLISTGGTVIKMPVEDVKRLGRSTQGVIVMRLREGETRLDARAGRRSPTTRTPTTGGTDARADDAATADVAERRRSRTTRTTIEPDEPDDEDERPAPSGASLSRSRALWSQLIGLGGPTEGSGRMAYSKQVDVLEPIDLSEHLDKVELYLGQVCRLAGISKMQLDYWTNKAQIPTKGKKQRIYDMDAIETVMLIKQGKDKGLNLGAAIDAARRFREQQAAHGSR